MLTFTLIIRYNISVKVGEKMKQNNLTKMLMDNNGILKTSDALAAGITKDALYRFIKDAALEKIAHGIYADPDELTDEMYLLQAQFPKAIFSHETALYLHDLSEREPVPLTVTVAANYNSAGLTKKGIKVYYTKKEWYDIGIVKMQSFGGHMIQVYDLERTICDMVRRYEGMDIAAFNYAAREYVRRKDKDYTKLSRYARELHIEQKIRERMGVLF